MLGGSGGFSGTGIAIAGGVSPLTGFLVFGVSEVVSNSPSSSCGAVGGFGSYRYCLT